VAHAHASVALGQLVEQRGHVVGGSVVDRDQLDVTALRGLIQDGPRALHEVALLAMYGEHDAQARHRQFVLADMAWQAVRR